MLLLILLVIHIGGGGVALLCGPVPMLTRKGGGIHRRAGRVFAVSLSLAAASAFLLSVAIHSRLLLAISVLTGFLLALGDRALTLRRGATPGIVDFGGCLILGGFGLWLSSSSLRPTDPTGLFFGIGGCLLSIRTMWQLRDPGTDWMLGHIAGMGGAYVATATAFLVVNNHVLPQAIVFIVPTMIGTVLITWSSARYVSEHAARQSYVPAASST